MIRSRPSGSINDNNKNKNDAAENSIERRHDDNDDDDENHDSNNKNKKNKRFFNALRLTIKITGLILMIIILTYAVLSTMITTTSTRDLHNNPLSTSLSESEEESASRLTATTMTTRNSVASMNEKFTVTTNDNDVINDKIMFTYRPRLDRMGCRLSLTLGTWALSNYYKTKFCIPPKEDETIQKMFIYPNNTYFTNCPRNIDKRKDYYLQERKNMFHTYFFNRTNNSSMRNTNNGTLSSNPPAGTYELQIGTWRAYIYPKEKSNPGSIWSYDMANKWKKVIQNAPYHYNKDDDDSSQITTDTTTTSRNLNDNNSNNQQSSSASSSSPIQSSLWLYPGKNESIKIAVHVRRGDKTPSLSRFGNQDFIYDHDIIQLIQWAKQYASSGGATTGRRSDVDDSSSTNTDTKTSTINDNNNHRNIVPVEVHVFSEDYGVTNWSSYPTDLIDKFHFAPSKKSKNSTTATAKKDLFKPTKLINMNINLRDWKHFIEADILFVDGTFSSVPALARGPPLPTTPSTSSSTTLYLPLTLYWRDSHGLFEKTNFYPQWWIPWYNTNNANKKNKKKKDDTKKGNVVVNISGIISS